MHTLFAGTPSKTTEEGASGSGSSIVFDFQGDEAEALEILKQAFEYGVHTLILSTTPSLHYRFNVPILKPDQNTVSIGIHYWNIRRQKKVPGTITRIKARRENLQAAIALVNLRCFQLNYGLMAEKDLNRTESADTFVCKAFTSNF